MAKKKSTPDPIDKARGIAAASLKGKFGAWRPVYEGLLGELRQGNLALIRRRCRESHVNSPVTASLVGEICTEVIGKGIRVEFKHKVKKHKNMANKLWEKWTMSKNFSSDGEMDFYQMQSLLAQEIAVVGEVFFKKNLEEDIEAEDMAKMIPISYQMMPPDQLYDQVDFGRSTIDIPDEYKNAKFIKGIGYNKRGKKVAYIVYEDDYETSQVFGYNFTSRAKKKVISAENVHHVYNRKEIRYRRGWPLIGTGIVYSHLVKLLDEAQLSKQLIAAIFAAFIHDNSADFSLEKGKGKEDDEEESEFDYDAELQSGTMYQLPTGKDVKFSDAPEARDYKDFDMAILRKIAASAGVSYESLASNHSDSNYSAARQSQMSASRRLGPIRENVIIKQFVDSCIEDFKKYLASMAILPVEELEAVVYRPAKTIIDPAKEINPKKEEVKAGFKAWREVIQESGRNPDTVAEQVKEDMALLKEMGVSLDGSSMEKENPSETSTQNT